MDTHTDDFIEHGPGLMQPIIRSAVSRREGPTAFFAPVSSASSLRGDVEGMSNDVAFAGLTSQGAIGVWTAARSAPLHTYLMAEKPREDPAGTRDCGAAGHGQQHFPEEAPTFPILCLLVLFGGVVRLQIPPWAQLAR